MNVENVFFCEAGALDSGVAVILRWCLPTRPVFRLLSVQPRAGSVLRLSLRCTALIGWLRCRQWCDAGSVRIVSVIVGAVFPLSLCRLSARSLFSRAVCLPATGSPREYSFSRGLFLLSDQCSDQPLYKWSLVYPRLSLSPLR